MTACGQSESSKSVLCQPGELSVEHFHALSVTKSAPIEASIPEQFPSKALLALRAIKLDDFEISMWSGTDQLELLYTPNG